PRHTRAASHHTSRPPTAERARATTPGPDHATTAPAPGRVATTEHRIGTNVPGFRPVSGAPCRAMSRPTVAAIAGLCLAALAAGCGPDGPVQVEGEPLVDGAP